MMKVDDLVEPRTEQIALAGVPTLLRPHESPRRRPQSSQGITARRPDQFARKPVHNGRNPANTITSRKQKLTAGQRLGSSSRTTERLRQPLRRPPPERSASREGLSPRDGRPVASSRNRARPLRWANGE